MKHNYIMIWLYYFTYLSIIINVESRGSTIGDCENWNPKRDKCLSTSLCHEATPRNIIIVYEPAPYGAGLSDRSSVVRNAMKFGRLFRLLSAFVFLF